MQRIKGWETILHEHITAARTRRFKWGLHDCSLFVCNIVLAMTGDDLAHDFRGRYSTRREARAVIKAFAEKPDLEALAVKRAAEFGMQEINPRLASRGDIVLIANERRQTTKSPNVVKVKALGIVGTDGMFAMCAGLKGLIRVPRSQWLRSWKV